MEVVKCKFCWTKYHHVEKLTWFSWTEKSNYPPSIPASAHISFLSTVSGFGTLYDKMISRCVHSVFKWKHQKLRSQVNELYRKLLSHYITLYSIGRRIGERIQPKRWNGNLQVGVWKRVKRISFSWYSERSMKKVVLRQFSRLCVWVCVCLCVWRVKGREEKKENKVSWGLWWEIVIYYQRKWDVKRLKAWIKWHLFLTVLCVRQIGTMRGWKQRR